MWSVWSVVSVVSGSLLFQVLEVLYKSKTSPTFGMVSVVSGQWLPAVSGAGGAVQEQAVAHVRDGQWLVWSV